MEQFCVKPKCKDYNITIQVNYSYVSKSVQTFPRNGEIKKHIQI